MSDYDGRIGRRPTTHSIGNEPGKALCGRDIFSHRDLSVTIEKATCLLCRNQAFDADANRGRPQSSDGSDVPALENAEPNRACEDGPETRYGRRVGV